MGRGLISIEFKFIILSLELHNILIQQEADYKQKSIF